MPTNKTMFGPVDYASKKVPDAYHCHVCKRHGCKLWRESNTCADMTDLVCSACLGGAVSDQIGSRVAAVPTAEGDTFWGYCAVPPDACKWWYSLPDTTDLRHDPRPSDMAELAMLVAVELRSRAIPSAHCAHNWPVVYVVRLYGSYADPQTMLSPYTLTNSAFDNLGPVAIATEIQQYEAQYLQEWAGDK